MKNFIYLLILMILGFECQAQTISGNISGHDYVDLGLPSGTKWATCNIGSSDHTEIGDNFAWGETDSKEEYYWYNYKFCKNKRRDKEDLHPVDFFKYVISKRIGKVDKRLLLQSKDDAATVNWGVEWRMPTKDETKELLEGCLWKFSDDFDGVEGYVGTSKHNGNTIFFPSFNFLVALWSSSLYNLGWGVEAFCVNFSEDEIGIDHKDRCYGRNIRAVAK